MNTGNVVVDEISSINFEGDIIPNTWYCHIKKETESKKGEKASTDLLAIAILSDLIYWFLAAEIRDEYTGHIRYEKKFKTNKFRKSYSSWAEKFGKTKRQIQASVKTLVDLGIVKREVVTIEREENGCVFTGVTYFEPVVEMIEYMFTPVSEKHPPIYIKNKQGD